VRDPAPGAPGRPLPRLAGQAPAGTRPGGLKATAAGRCRGRRPVFPRVLPLHAVKAGARMSKESANVPSSNMVLWSLVVGAWGLLAVQWLLPDASATARTAAAPQAFGESSVERINVVDGNGRTRLVIANSERFPDPVVRGKVHARSLRNPAGMVFSDADGVEPGGLATMTSAGGQRMAGTIFDFNHQPTDGIGIMKSESADGSSWMAGLAIADRVPSAGGDSQTTDGVSRIVLSNRSGDAPLGSADPRGRPRLRLGVGSNDVPGCGGRAVDA